ncbi:MAG: sortase domain-containing protein, partial [Gemmatimonadaceae bacterium]
GNSVVSAHRDMHFRRLGELRAGDTVVTVTEYHRKTWRITGRRIVSADAAALFPTPDATLTLTTCWPMRYIGPAPDRLLLTAEPVDAADAADALPVDEARAPESVAVKERLG